MDAASLGDSYHPCLLHRSGDVYDNGSRGRVVTGACAGSSRTAVGFFRSISAAVILRSPAFGGERAWLGSPGRLTDRGQGHHFRGCGRYPPPKPPACSQRDDAEQHGSPKTQTPPDAGNGRALGSYVAGTGPVGVAVGESPAAAQFQQTRRPFTTGHRTRL